MSRVWIFIFLASSLFAKVDSYFDYSHLFNLNKDEVAKISVIKKDYKTNHQLDGELKFRWTLFHNDLLILLVNYEGFSFEHVLKKEPKRDSVDIELLSDYQRFEDRVFLVLKFIRYRDGTADIEAHIRDPKNKIEVEFIEPKRGKF